MRSETIYVGAAGVALGLAARMLWEYWRDEGDEQGWLPVPSLRGVGLELLRGGSGPKLTQSLGYDKVRKKQAQILDVEKSVDLRGIFNDLAGSDKRLSQEEFCEAMTDRLKLDLTKDELHRVWRRICLMDLPVAPDEGAKPHLSRRGSSGVSSNKDVGGLMMPVRERSMSLSESHEIDFETFRRGVANVAFLRHMVTQLSDDQGAINAPEQTPAGYDFGKSTNENYSVGEGRAFYGKFVDIRKKLDYSYHVNTTQARQMWQDRAVDSVVARTEAQANPWVVYTCGPMGAGKGFVLAWMSRNGYFPLEDIVHIDPDHFKRLMPEWERYVAHHRERAGDMCHRESGLLQELAQEVTMRNNQNVWVDGSLRDGKWFAQVFRDVRTRFPQYKIAIFEVSASESVVRKRIAQRAAATGRDVPEHLIKASLASVTTSLDILTPLADFVARIDNDDAEPRLRAYIRVDGSGNWGQIEAQFALSEEAGSFPGSLPPITLTACPVDIVVKPGEGAEKVPATPRHRPRASFGQTTLEIDASHPELRPVRAALKETRLQLSPAAPVTLQGAARRRAGIPEEAETFHFAYPAAIEWSEIESGADTSAPVCRLPLAGGFVYFDADGAVCAINAVSSLVNEEEPSAAATDGASSSSSPSVGAGSMLQFGSPLPLDPRTKRALGSRLRSVTLAPLLARGATHFAFITPSDELPGLSRAPRGGAFAYLLSRESPTLPGCTACYFPVAG